MGLSFSILVAVDPSRHKSFAETRELFPQTPRSDPKVLSSGGKTSLVKALEEIFMNRVEKSKKKNPEEKRIDMTESDHITTWDFYGEKVDHSKGSKSWLGPTGNPFTSEKVPIKTPPQKFLETKTAASTGPEKFKIPENREKMAPADSSIYDTLLMTPETESQIFKLRNPESTKYDNLSWSSSIAGKEKDKKKKK